VIRHPDQQLSLTMMIVLTRALEHDRQPSARINAVGSDTRVTRFS